MTRKYNKVFNLEGIFKKVGEKPTHTITLTQANRSIFQSDGVSIILDTFSHGIESAFLRYSCREKDSLTITLPSGYIFRKCSLGGWCAIPEDDQSIDDTYWFPTNPLMRSTDAYSRILSEETITPSSYSVNAKQISVDFDFSSAKKFDVVVWRFDSKASNVFGQLLNSSALERQGFFSWGSHKRVETAATLYQHLIHGFVYDWRWAWPHGRKSFSENEAHALYTIFSGLGKSTGKVIYRYLQQQIVLSLIHRQSEDGGWYHGTWTEDMECHYRLHTSGVHLLMDEYVQSTDPLIKTVLEKAVSFLSNTRDKIDAGVWFLHDSLEQSEEAMDAGPFQWVKSRILGKRLSNMIVLNTHLDTTIALDRYHRVTGDNRYRDLVRSAQDTTEFILNLRPAQALYTLLFKAIGLTMLPTKQASALPVSIRVIKRITWKYLIKRLPEIKAKWPRLVMPNGYIDREITLKTWALDYQTINLMDLARYSNAFPNRLDESIVDKSFEFTQSSGLTQRYHELKGKQYAIGFWAEALYHRCLKKEEMKYRGFLADAILDLHDRGFGQAPSLLGTNCEAVLAENQFRCPLPSSVSIWIANLATQGRIEILAINTSNRPEKLNWEVPPECPLTWHDSDLTPLEGETLTIDARSWIRGYYIEE